MRHHPGARVLVAVWASVAMIAAAEDEPFPFPAVEGVDAAVAEQIEAERRRLEALSDVEVPAAERSARWGEAGRVYLAYNFTRAAAEAFRRAARLEPESFDLHYLLGVAREREGDLGGAADALARATALRPADAAAWVRRGRVALGLGLLDEAREAFGRAAAEGAEAAAAFGLGRIAALEGDHETALVRFRRALELQPGASAVQYPLAQALRQTGDLEGAMAAVARRGETEVAFQDPLVESLRDVTSGVASDMARGARLLVHGQLEEALTAFDAALAVDPDHPAALRNRADTLQRLGRVNEAVAAYRRALAAGPQPAVTRYNLGTALLARGDLDGAVEAFDATLAEAPDFVRAAFNRATALARAGRLEQAAAGFASVVAASPDDAEAHRQLGVALVDLGRLEEGREALRRAVSLDPGDRRARYRLGKVLLETGAMGEAETMLRSVVGEAEVPAPLLGRVELELARLALRRGEVEDAIQRSARAATLAPGLADAPLVLADALVVAGRFGDARTVLDAARERAPSHVDTVHALARLLALCPAPEACDPLLALKLATAVADAVPAVGHFETVALAHARLGDLASATVWQERAVHGAESAGAPESVVAALRERLEAYRRAVADDG